MTVCKQKMVGCVLGYVILLLVPGLLFREKDKMARKLFDNIDLVSY